MNNSPSAIAKSYAPPSVLRIINGFAAKFPAGNAPKLKALPQVKYIEKDQVFKSMNPTTTFFKRRDEQALLLFSWFASAWQAIGRD